MFLIALVGGIYILSTMSSTPDAIAIGVLWVFLFSTTSDIEQDAGGRLGASFLIVLIGYLLLAKISMFFAIAVIGGLTLLSYFGGKKLNG